MYETRMVDTKCFRIHVVNEEIAQYEQFLLLPHVFVDVSYCLYNLKGPFLTDELSGVFDLSEFELSNDFLIILMF